MTPTPTPSPVPWATLTPLPTSAATAAINLGSAGVNVAERVVQGYQFANSVGAMDLLMFGIFLFLIVGGIWSIIRHVRSL